MPMQFTKKKSSELRNELKTWILLLQCSDIPTFIYNTVLPHAKRIPDTSSSIYCVYLERENYLHARRPHKICSFFWFQ